APRRVLPAGRGEQAAPRRPGALVVDQPHLAVRALKPLIEARVTTGADHRHGKSPSPSKDGRSADRYPLGAYNGKDPGEVRLTPVTASGRSLGRPCPAVATRAVARPPPEGFVGAAPVRTLPPGV